MATIAAEVRRPSRSMAGARVLHCAVLVALFLAIRPGIAFGQEFAPGQGRPPQEGEGQPPGEPPREVLVILTFDDGPDGRSDVRMPHAGSASDERVNRTANVLNFLASRRHNGVQDGVKAAFFVQTHTTSVERGSSQVGRALLRRMADEDHEVAIHTGSATDHELHTRRVRAAGYDVDGDGRVDGSTALDSDLLASTAHISSWTGIAPRYVRPPEGRRDSEVLEAYQRGGLEIILWDVDSGDSRDDATRDSIPRNVRAEMEREIDEGNERIVILLHDINPKTNEATVMSRVIREILDAGRSRRVAIRFPSTRQEIREAFDARADQR